MRNPGLAAVSNPAIPGSGQPHDSRTFASTLRPTSPGSYGPGGRCVLYAFACEQTVRP